MTFPTAREYLENKGADTILFSVGSKEIEITTTNQLGFTHILYGFKYKGYTDTIEIDESFLDGIHIVRFMSLPGHKTIIEMVNPSILIIKKD